MTLVSKTGPGTVRNDRILLIGGEYGIEGKMQTKFADMDALIEKCSFMCKRPAGVILFDKAEGGGKCRVCASVRGHPPNPLLLRFTPHSTLNGFFFTR